MLVLVILLWPRPKPQDTMGSPVPPTNALTRAAPPVRARLPALRPRDGLAKPEGQPELPAGAKAELARLLGGEVKLPVLNPAVVENLTKDFPPLLLACPDNEINAYLDRVKVLGEVEALRWLKSKQVSR